MPNNISYPSLDLVAPAKQYAAEGFRVFPLKLNSKLPATKNGFKDAVSDPALIEKMFAKHKGNIAITPPPEIFIIDVDVKHGIDGKANLNDLCRKHGGITKTRFQQTPSGGLHLIYRKPADVIVPQSAGKLAPGVDVRTDKGYIVAAPSVIVPWLKPYDMNDHEIAVAPQWLLDLLVNGKPKEVASSERGRIVDGGRNVGLTSYAGSLRNRGRDEEAILEALRIRNEKDCDPPLDDEELRKIAHSVGKYAPDARDGTDATRSLTELGNAYRLADSQGDNLRFIYETKNWLVFRKGAWQWDSDGAAVRGHAAKLPQIIYNEGAAFIDQAKHFVNWARVSSSSKTICNAVKVLSDMSAIRLSVNVVDADGMLAGFDNARQVIDLRTGKVRPAERQDYVTKSLNVSTLGEATKAARWLQFLDEIFEGDQELVGWLQRWCGYLLTGETCEQIFLFFFGLGANGKSVFAETIMYLMGDYVRAVSAETLTDTKRQAGGATPDLADLMGSRLASSTETEDGAVLAESRIKSITGGDTISVRKLYCEPFEFKPAFKLLIVGNHRPQIRGVDYAIWRRVRLVPFNITFDEKVRDLKLKDKLKAEAPHILAWMAEGCLRWQQTGLGDVPKVIAEQTAGYRKEQDVLGEWLLECVDNDPAGEETKANVYECYKKWAEAAGLRPMAKVSLGRKLSERGITDRAGTHNVQHWTGIRIRPDKTEPDF